jgi:hypothetical protein
VQAGLIRMATASEVAANTPNVAVTPNNLGKRVVAFAGFDGSSATISPTFSFGITSITRQATGRYRITFAAGVLSSENYSVAANCVLMSATDHATSVNMFFGGEKTATQLDICVSQENATNYVQPAEITVTIFQ